MPQDSINQRFGRLIIINDNVDLKKLNSTKKIVECLCDCGVIKSFQLSNLKDGNTKSCGCLKVDLRTTHGLRQSPEYQIWNGIKQRCYNEKHIRYNRYGGRGITVCDEWLNSFETFYKDMGPRPSPDYSIDREKNDLGYSKDNCRWVTRKEQQNNLSNNIFYTYKGETKNLTDWCRELGLSFSKIYQRIEIGWSFEEAVKIARFAADERHEINGIVKTMLEWCNNSRLLLASVCNKVRIGWTFEEALRPIEKEVFEFEESKLTLCEWCDLMGLDKNTTYHRIIRGELLANIINE